MDGEMMREGGWVGVFEGVLSPFFSSLLFSSLLSIASQERV
jgi:hypothetical protein